MGGAFLRVHLLARFDFPARLHDGGRYGKVTLEQE